MTNRPPCPHVAQTEQMLAPLLSPGRCRCCTCVLSQVKKSGNTVEVKAATRAAFWCLLEEMDSCQNAYPPEPLATSYMEDVVRLFLEEHRALLVDETGDGA